MPAIADAFMRLRVDSSVVKRDTERGIDAADTSKAGKAAGKKFGGSFTPEVGKRAGGFTRFIHFGAAGKKGGRQFGDGFTAEFSARTVSAIGPSILGLGAKASFIGLGGTLAAGLLPSLLGGLSAGVVAAGGIGTILLGAKGLIGSKKEQGPLYKAATSAGEQFKTAFQKGAAQLQAPLAKAFAEVPKIIKAIQPGLNELFKGAGTLIQPLVAGLTRFAQVALPLLGQAFRAVAPLMRPLVDALTGIVRGLLPGMIELIKASGPAVHALASVLADIAGGLGDVFRASVPAIKASSVLLTAFGRVLRALLNVIGNLAVSAANALAPAFATFAKILDGLVPFLKILGDLISMIAEAMLHDLNWALQGVLDLFNNIEPALTAFLKAISNVFWVLENSGAFQALGLALVQIVPLLSNLINSVLRQLTVLLPPIIEMFGQVAATLGNTLAHALSIVLPVIAQLAQQALGTIAKILPVIIPPLLQVVGIIGNAFANAAKTILPPLMQLAMVVLTALAKLLPIIIVPLAQMAAMLAGVFASAIAAILPVLTQIVQTVFAALAKILPVILPPILQLAKIIGGALLTALKILLPPLGQLIDVLVGALADVLVQILPPIAQLAKVLTQSLAKILIAILPSIVLLAGALVQLLVALLPIIPPIVKIVTLLLQLALKVLTPLVIPVLQLLIGAVALLVKGLAIVIGWIVQFVRLTVQGFKAVFNWVKGNWPLLLPILLGPIGLAAAGVIKYWRQIRDGAVWLWHQLVHIWGLISAAFQFAWSWIYGHVLVPIGNFFVHTIPAWATAGYHFLVNNFWNPVKNAFISSWNWVYGHVLAPIGHFFGSTLPAWLGNAMRWISAHFLTPFRNAFNAAWKWVYQHVWTPFYNFMTRTLPNWFGQAVGAVQRAWNAIKKSIGEPVWAVAHYILSPLAGGLSKVLGWVGVHLNVKPLNDFIAKIPHWRTGGRLPGYGGGDTQPAMLERGETVVSKEHSRLPFMRAAFAAAGVPGYQFGGIIGGFIKSVGGALGFGGGGGGNPITGALGAFIKAIPGIGPALSVAGDVLSLIPGAQQLALKAILAISGAGDKLGVSGFWSQGLRHMPEWLLSKVLDYLKGKISDHLNATTGGGLGSIPGGGSVSGAAAKAQAWAKAYMARVYHWTGIQWSALKNLWTGESGWNYRAYNASSGATGIPQSLPGNKMAAAGPDWRTNPATQIRWGLAYIKSVYGTPLRAWQMWLNRNPHWYRKGGLVSFDTGGRLPEDIFGIGPSGRQYQLHRGEDVVPSGGGDLLTEIRRLRKAVEDVPARTAAGVAKAIQAPRQNAVNAARVGAR